MNRKKTSAIVSIELNSATFTDVKVKELTYINLFYGKNGTGKSTLAYAVKQNDGVVLADGRSAQDYDVIVFNQDFIERNFSNYHDIPGVFTVSEENIQIQKEIEEKFEKKRLLEIEKNDVLEEWKRMKEIPIKLFTDFKNECWSKTASLRTKFSGAMSGKKTKKSLAEAILHEENPQEHEISELTRLYNIVFDDSSRAYPKFSKVDLFPTYAKLPGKELMDKVISNSGNTPFAQFMNAINATDWVRSGHIHYSGTANGRCPYCQQKLPENFEKKIAECFDAQYRNDLQSIQYFKSTYAKETAEIIGILKDNLIDVIDSKDMSEILDDYKLKLDTLKKLFEINRLRIDEKINEPTKIVILEDTDSLLLEIGVLINVINKLIMENNNLVAQKCTEKDNCKKWIIEHIAFELRAITYNFRNEMADIKRQIVDIEVNGKQLANSINELNTQIAQLNSQTVNTEAAISNINNILKESGFQGFMLQAKKDVQHVYEVIRENNGFYVPAENLSEGERNFIAFLYFYNMAYGSMNKNESKEKIIVIDDPVSGMDSSALFIVSSLIRNMINSCTKNAVNLVSESKIKQMFILTHNERFYREISYRQVNCYDLSSFYVIRKWDNASSVSLCERKNGEMMENYNPVSDAYSTLWNELKEISSSASAVNVMRRIIEQYFIQTCGYDEGELRETILSEAKSAEENGDMRKYQFASYILEGNNGAQEMIYTEEHDINEYMQAFRLIFDILGHNRHYCMMTGAGEGSTRIRNR